MASAEPGVMVRYRVIGFSDRWTLPEGNVPEAPWHYDAAERFRSRCEVGLERAQRNAAVFRNLAIRVLAEQPRLGFDPDICIVEPRPTQGDIDSLKLWLPESPVPRLVVEIVSKSHPTKDYVEVPDQCAAIGVEELVLFDPSFSAPRAHGGRRLLSVWRRAPDGGFERAHAGDGTAYSQVLRAWLVPDAARKELFVADDREGQRAWPTRDEAERAAKEAERAAKEAERAAKESALRRVAELEAELSRKR